MAVRRKKRKTLPKDFERQLEAGCDLMALKRVFDACDLNARDRSFGRTALMMPKCPDALARWLVEQGADVQAVDHYGNNALHLAADYGRDPALLIDLGCNVRARDEAGNTPLHSAADAKNLVAVERLLAAGAQVNAKNDEGFTPLELGLRGCRNIDIVPMVPVAKRLLAAGAKETAAMKVFVQQIGTNFEFHRAAFAKDHVKATSSALLALCRLFSVDPPPHRVMHDGKSPIVATARTWQKQYDELWDLLVPSSGPAVTVQGEVIRITGRIGNEIYRNSGANWDRDYTQMAQAFLKYIRVGRPLSNDHVLEAETIVKGIVKQRGDGDHNHARLTQLAVEWVRRNPQPTALGRVRDKR